MPMSWLCWLGLHRWEKGGVFSQFLGHQLLCKRCDVSAWEWYK